MINGWRDGPRCSGASVAQGRPFDRLRTGTGHGRGKRRPFDYAQGRPYGCMVGRAGERWKGEVAREAVL